MLRLRFVVVPIADVIWGGPDVARSQGNKCVGDDEDYDLGSAAAF